jgi:uncharacterized protein YabN with tetrapyrrole methylase and pyrophosphatase domain
MKTIAALKGADFLRACNRVRYAAQEMLSETKVLEIRKHMPKLTEDMTEAQRKAAMEKQSKKNISDMLDRLLEEKPEETYKFLESVILHEEGEELDGIDLMCAAMELVSDPKVVDFLSRLTRLVLPNTGV